MQKNVCYKMLTCRQIYYIKSIICSTKTYWNDMMPLYSWRFSLNVLKCMFTPFLNQLIVDSLIVHAFIYY